MPKNHKKINGKTVEEWNQYFLDEFVSWMNRLTVGPYTVRFAHWDETGFDRDDGDAALAYDTENMWVRVSVNPKIFSYPNTETYVSRAALHEATHALTGRLFDHAMNRFACEDEIVKETEVIAKCLENAFFGTRVDQDA